ncbi:MAG: hypothetical protein KIG57_03995, partial [Muribaculaceae bacterium]|nr:hypothetical protein [Muribaculaceae bacterium]
PTGRDMPPACNGYNPLKHNNLHTNRRGTILCARPTNPLPMFHAFHPTAIGNSLLLQAQFFFQRSGLLFFVSCHKAISKAQRQTHVPTRQNLQDFVI